MTEHLAKAMIRDALSKLSAALADLEQTTHGYIGSDDIRCIADNLTACYQNPSAYSVSNLSQSIERFLKKNV